MDRAYLATFVHLHQLQMMRAIIKMIPAYNINYNWNKYFTITEVSKIIGIERRAVYRLKKNNKIMPSFGTPI